MKSQDKNANKARGMNLQKKVLILPLLFILFIPLTPNSTTAFVPEDEKIVLNLLNNGSTDLDIGDNVEIIILLKNYTNNTMSNITLTQTLPSTIKLVETPYSTFNGTAINFTNVNVFEKISKSNFAVNYINATSSNFTMNFDKLFPLQLIAFSYQINATEQGLYTINDQVSAISATRITYYDEFEDPHDINGQNEIILQVSEVELNEKLGSFPDVDVDDFEVNTILLISGLVLIVALLGRSLYFKKPLDI